MTEFYVTLNEYSSIKVVGCDWLLSPVMEAVVGLKVMSLLMETLTRVE